MNSASADSSETAALKTSDEGEPPVNLGWTWRKVFFLIALAFIFHIALIYFFGTKKQIIPRPLKNVPQLELADSADELIALDNPALFALPNPRDFAAAVWTKIPAVASAKYHYTEPPHYLSLPAEKLGTTFSRFMQTNQFAQPLLDFKPQPQFTAPDVSVESSMPQNSTFKIIGDLAQRPLLASVDLPAIPFNDVIPPSKVQLLVDATGNVISAVLLPSNNSSEAAEHYDFADQRALEFAKQLRFAPATKLTIGEVLFRWQTTPVVSTNTPANQ